MVKNTCLTMLFGMLIHSAASASENFMLTPVENLPLSIRQVSRCGAWQEGGRSGYFRVVVGDVAEGAGSELYIQVVTDAGQETPSSLVRTIPVSELNDDHAQYYFKSVECVKAGRFYQVNVRALYEHDDVERTHYFSIRLVEADRYQFLEKSK